MTNSRWACLNKSLDHEYNVLQLLLNRVSLALVIMYILFYCLYFFLIILKIKIFLFVLVSKYIIVHK